MLEIERYLRKDQTAKPLRIEVWTRPSRTSSGDISQPEKVDAWAIAITMTRFDPRNLTQKVVQLDRHIWLLYMSSKFGRKPEPHTKKNPSLLFVCWMTGMIDLKGTTTKKMTNYWTTLRISISCWRCIYPSTEICGLFIQPLHRPIGSIYLFCELPAHSTAAPVDGTWRDFPIIKRCVGWGAGDIHGEGAFSERNLLGF